MPSAEYYREWRANHPDYRKRQNEVRNLRRKTNGRESRVVEYSNRKSRAVPKLTQLFPELNRGTNIAFYDDELRMDIQQERYLAELEGRDPDIAEKEYWAKEKAWQRTSLSTTEYDGGIEEEGYWHPNQSYM